MEKGHHTQHKQRIIDERLDSLIHPAQVPPLNFSELEDEPYESATGGGMFSDADSWYNDTSNEELEYDDVVVYNTETSHHTSRPGDGGKNKGLDSNDERVLWWDGYYCCAMQQADDVDVFFGMCFNCRDGGHHWWECPRPQGQKGEKVQALAVVNVPK